MEHGRRCFGGGRESPTLSWESRTSEAHFVPQLQLLVLKLSTEAVGDGDDVDDVIDDVDDVDDVHNDISVVYICIALQYLCIPGIFMMTE